MATGSSAGLQTSNRSVELISTGDELLAGYGLNTHAQTLGGALSAVGWRLVRDTTIGDDAGHLEECLQAALERSPVIVVTGGLGPTPDDITVDVVAAMLGREITLDPEAVERIRSRGSVRGLPPSAARERQARVVAGARVLQNTVGMAPGELLDLEGRLLFLLPGPPLEFKAMLEHYLLPCLAGKAPAEPDECRALLRLCGCGESDVCEQFAEAGIPASGVSMGFRAIPDCLEIRFRAPAAAAAAFQRTLSVARSVLGSAVFTDQDLELEAVVCSLLKQRGRSLAVAESCTGGLLGGRLTTVPGSSTVFTGGVIAYSNSLKTRFLQVDPRLLATHGAVSRETALAMAEGVRHSCGSDYGLAITGIAGPGGGTAERPVGLVYVALEDDEGATVLTLRRGGTRDQVRNHAVVAALDLLRRRLLGATHQLPHL